MTDDELAAETNKVITSFVGRPAYDVLNILCNALVCVAKGNRIGRRECIDNVRNAYDTVRTVRLNDGH